LVSLVSLVIGLSRTETLSSLLSHYSFMASLSISDLFSGREREKERESESMVDSEQSVEIYSFKSTGTDLKCWSHAH